MDRSGKKSIYGWLRQLLEFVPEKHWAGLRASYRRMAEDAFSEPVALHVVRKAWIQSDVDDWIASASRPAIRRPYDGYG